jgi:hypothetical protein
MAQLVLKDEIEKAEDEHKPSKDGGLTEYLYDVSGWGEGRQGLGFGFGEGWKVLAGEGLVGLGSNSNVQPTASCLPHLLHTFSHTFPCCQPPI